MSAKRVEDKMECEAKSKIPQPSKLKRRDSGEAKAAPKEEKRIAHHTSDMTDAKGSISSRPSSGSGPTGAKESKLKQPEVVVKRVSSASPSHAPPPLSKPLVHNEGPSKKPPPPLPERQPHALSSRGISKQNDSSLHKVRSVQSLANEIRRIKSMQTADDEPPHKLNGTHRSHPAIGDAKKKPSTRSMNASTSTTITATKPSDNSIPTAITTDKKPSMRSKIKLKITEPSTIEEQNELDELLLVPGRLATHSPTFSTSHRGSEGVSPSRLSNKGGINRNNFVQGLGLNFAIDIQQSDVRVDKSFDLSSSGTFDAVGFQIKQSGITRSPTKREEPNKPTNAKKYLIKFGVLGRGASGVVHKALHVPSLLLVAVKVIPVFENEKRHQLIAELKALYNNLSTLSDDGGRKSVACPEIVCLYDAFMNPNEGNVSIVVEYMDGGSLQDIVETGGCKSESVLANISYRVLKGLSFLHSTNHQIHRDIKPSNLLINHHGDVKISDFGIVREMENSMAKATTFVGTLTYMSPERIASEEYSYNSDVWSFGLSIMTCALGRFPYASKGGYWELLHMIRNEPPPQLPEGEFSDTFRDFLDKCLKKDQQERWSVKQLLNHEFVRQCERGGGIQTTVSDDEEEDSKRGSDEECSDVSTGLNATSNDCKENIEVDEIVHKVVEYYMKEAKELIVEGSYTLKDIATWIQQLPAMQKIKLARFADQVGVQRRVVYSKFHFAMNELLQDLEELYFDDVKSAK